eukprot:evm.model.scf_3775.1 EVM.evm.TU.scf_3775.1   scf_3775:816-5470(-)
MPSCLVDTTSVRRRGTLQSAVDFYASTHAPIALFSGTCGSTACALPNLCLTVKKTVKKLVEVPVAVCAEPKLVCKKIEKPCGDTSCGYDETCKKSQTCSKAAPYGPPPTTVSPAAGEKSAPYYPPTATVSPAAGQTAPKPYVMPGAAPTKAAPAVATANAVATSSQGEGPAVANANAYATSSPSPAAPKYPAPYPSQVGGAAGGAYGDGYKPACKDTFTCEKIDPKVCKTETHLVCVERDPKSAEPGYYQGYPLGWQPGYVAGQKCGDTVCSGGSFCATCEVEVCLDAVLEKDAARCGYDAKGVPTFCPSGHMCTELCPPEKKYVTVEVEESVCVSPSDVTYADEVAAAATTCGPNKCLPGYECANAPVKVCGPSPTGVDGASGDDPSGYYFYYDPNGSEDSKDMPGYYFYPHDEAGDDSGCGYYRYPRPESASPQAAYPTPPAPRPYYSYPSLPTAGGSGAGSPPYYSYGYPSGYSTPSSTGGNSGSGDSPYYGYGYPSGYSTPSSTGGNSGSGDSPYYGYGYPSGYSTPSSTGGNSGSGNSPYYGYGYPYGYSTPSSTGGNSGSGKDPYYSYGYPYGYSTPATNSGLGKDPFGYGYPYYTGVEGSSGGDDSKDPYYYPYTTASPSSGGNGGKGKYYRPSSPAPKQVSGGNSPPTYIPRPTTPARKEVSDDKVEPKAPAYVPEPIPAVPASESGPSTAKSVSTSKSEGGNVYVWGASETSGDGEGTIDATASSGDDTSATITGGSSYGKAKVECDIKSADGKVADCKGTANHD